MIYKIFLSELIASIILITLLVLLVNPFDFWMPNALLIMMVVGLVVVFAVYVSFFWKENALDEREGFHKMFAGRVAFLAGTGTLVAGIIIQSLQHSLDFWLVATLGIMIIAKIIGRIYSQVNN